MIRLCPALLFVGVTLAGCLPKTPAQICASPDVHRDLTDVLIGNLDDYRFLFGDRFDAVIDRRSEIAEAIQPEIRFADIALEASDKQTGRITCSTNVSPTSGDGDSYRLVFTRQKEAGGREYLYTTTVYDNGPRAETAETIPDIWFAKLLLDARQRLDNPRDQALPADGQQAENGNSGAADTPSEEDTLFESRGVRLVQDNEAGDVFCVGCQGSPRRRPLNVGRVFFEKAWGDFVLLTRDTGNAVAGGTTYSVNLRTLQIFDLQTDSAAGPEFDFQQVDGGVVVEITEDGRRRRLALAPPRTASRAVRNSTPPALSVTENEGKTPERQSAVDPKIATTPASWLRQPVANMPQRAVDDGVSGWAELRCGVDEGGRVSGCEIMDETPAGYGLGRAAVLGSIGSGLLRPATAGDSPVSSTIRFRVNFRSQ